MDAPHSFLFDSLDNEKASPPCFLKLDKSPAMLKWFQDQLNSHYTAGSAQTAGESFVSAIGDSLSSFICEDYDIMTGDGYLSPLCSNAPDTLMALDQSGESNVEVPFSISEAACSLSQRFALGTRSSLCTDSGSSESTSLTSCQRRCSNPSDDVGSLACAAQTNVSSSDRSSGWGKTDESLCSGKSRSIKRRSPAESAPRCVPDQKRTR
eukprot:jgi/Botrbrau1/1111/Bobra.0162s0012.1